MSPNPSLTHDDGSTSPLTTKGAQKQNDFHLTGDVANTPLPSKAKVYPGTTHEEDRRRLYQQFLRATNCRPTGQLAEEKWWASTEELRKCQGANPETVFFAALRQWFAWRDTEFSCSLPSLVSNWERFYRPNHNDFAQMRSGRWQPHIADFHPTRPMVVAQEEPSGA